jgi:hypothetical protein
MMTQPVDRRAMIIGRLVELFSGFTVQLQGDGISGPVSIDPTLFVHNRGELPGTQSGAEPKIPGLILLDADEVKDPRFVPKDVGRQLPIAPQVMRMTPEIYIVLDVRKPNNINVGEDLNTARAALLDLILHDSVLQSIVGANGQIIYDGCVTDLARNRTMRGQMGLSITFVYPLIPGQLLGFNA